MSDDVERTHPVRLPGVGERLDLRDEDGVPVAIVRRKDGRVEVHHGELVCTLDAEDAQALGAFVTGHYAVAPEILHRTAGVVGGLAFDWVTVPAGSHASGRSIQELAFRRTTGVTIVAILRGSQPIIDPDADVRLQEGDDLVVACRPDDRAALERFLAQGGP